MPKKKKTEEKIEKMIKTKCKTSNKCTTGGGLYCVGFIGALVYNISIATGFWNGAWGVLKALVWPAFLVYKLMQHMGM